jgi:hypothetical protein
LSTLASAQDVLLQATHREAGDADFSTGAGVVVSLLDGRIRELGRPERGQWAVAGEVAAANPTTVCR